MYECQQIHGTIYMDTMGGWHKSLDRNRYAQVFVNNSFFAVSYPMDKKSNDGQALEQFNAEFGIPDRIVCDGSGEQTGKRMEFTSTASIIHKALYGLKSSRATFRAHLAETLYDIGIWSSKADPDIWLR